MVTTLFKNKINDLNIYFKSIKQKKRSPPVRIHFRSPSARYVNIFNDMNLMDDEFLNDQGAIIITTVGFINSNSIREIV